LVSASRESSRLTLKSNPHSARCPTYTQSPATSCLGAFQTPAAGHLNARSLCHYRRLKTLYGAFVVKRRFLFFDFVNHLFSNSIVRPPAAILPSRPLVPSAGARSGGQWMARLRATAKRPCEHDGKIASARAKHT